MDKYLLSQLQLECAAFQLDLIQAQQEDQTSVTAGAEVKEYKEDWRKTPVYRQGGKFASSDAKETAGTEEEASPEGTQEEEETEAESELEALLNLKSTTINEQLKEFENQQVKGVQDKVLDTVQDRLDTMLARKKEMASELTDLMFGERAAQARHELAELVKPIDIDLSKTIEEDPFKEIKGDISDLKKEANAENLTKFAKHFPKALEYAGTKYNAIAEELESSQGDNKLVKRATGTMMTIAGPTAIALAAIMGPWAVVPAIAGAAGGAAAGGLATVGTWVAVHATVYRSMNEIFDELGIEHPLVRNVYTAGMALVSPVSWFDVAYRTFTAHTSGRRTNLSGRSPSEQRELLRIKTETRKKLESLRKEADQYNKDVEKSLKAAKDLLEALEKSD